MKSWLYFLIDDEGRSWRKNGDVIEKVGNPTPLPETPDGWQDLSIGFERNMNRYGIVRSFSLPLGFVKTANAILRYVTLTGSVETKLFLLIKKLSVETTNTLFRFIYRYFYKGELDLSTVQLEDDRSTVQIMEGGVTKLLAANEGTTYEIDVENDPEAIFVNTNGYISKTTLKYKVIETNNFTPTGASFTLPMFLASREGYEIPKILTQDVFLEDLITGPNFVPAESVFFFRINEPAFFQYRIQGTVTFINEAAFSYNAQLRFNSHNRGNDIDTQVIYNSGVVSYAPGQHTITFDFTITVPGIIVDAESIYGVFTAGDELSLLETDITITYDYRHPATQTKALKPTTLLKRLCGKALNNEDAWDSNLLTANQNLVITCGDALRGIEGAKIKTSLRDFFTAYNCWYNIGMGVEDRKLKIEEKSYFFPQTGTPFHLGEAKKLKIAFASELFCNTIKTGYPSQNYEDNFGKFEFNCTHLFTTPITKVVKELALISPYRADPTGIEYVRINYEGKSTTDSNSDNDVFVLNVDINNPVDGVYPLKRETYTTVLGLPTESQSTMFNIEQLTPKRILLQHGNWVRSVLKGTEADFVRFQTTDKNRDLRTVTATSLVDEDKDENIGALTAPLFQPYLLEFDCQSPDGLVESLEDNPNQRFSFTWDGNTFYGFIMKAGIAPDNNKEQTITLLSAVDNDITKLI